jgi:predicted restriction endonuclease
VRPFAVLSDSKSEDILAGLELGPGEKPMVKALKNAQATIAASGEFDLSNADEGREKTLASIVRRRGQPEFRKKLIALYEGRCTISGCDAQEALEAAHIVPYNGPKTDHPCNGLLVRADLHTLFDLGLMAVATPGFKVILAPSLKHTTYAQFEGKTLRLPKDSSAHPSREALERHRQAAKL